jgi:hypothetical protein
MKALKIAFFLGGAFVIFIIIYTLVDVFHCAHIAATKTQMLSNLNQIGIATLLYREDNDSSFPHASSMPTFRAQISKYLKSPSSPAINSTIFKGIKNEFTEPQFNFNLAGVKVNDYLLPLVPSKSINVDEAVLGFSFPFVSDVNCKAVVVYADTLARSIPNNKSFSYSDFLGTQFSRPNITLAPADYLADQDPLKK